VLIAQFPPASQREMASQITPLETSGISVPGLVPTRTTASRAGVITWLATGSRPRRLAVPGTDLVGVHVLRTIADADRIRAEYSAGGRAVIIGGGYIGLEVAATARELGLDVTVLEMTERVMNRVTCPQVSAFYAAEHARRGVRIRCNETVRALHGDASTGRVRCVLTEQGGEYPADVVVIGVGVVPADELAKAAGSKLVPVFAIAAKSNWKGSVRSNATFCILPTRLL